MAGAPPEQVLVIEIAGTVADFRNAVRRIPGLEWLGESDQTTDPDEDFFVESDEDDGQLDVLNGELFLVFSNQEALEELISLWTRYAANPDMRFEWGYAKWRTVFQHLRVIRPWDARDRVDRSGVTDDWGERLAAGQGAVPTEVELWFRDSEAKRAEAERIVRTVVATEGGEVLDRALVPEISYHAVLASLPAQAARRIMEHDGLALARYQGVMLFRPVGQAVAVSPDRGAGEESAAPPVEIGGNPIVALLDGLPVQNHNLLTGRLRIDDPDSWGDDYPAHERIHGTAMASLILWNELDQAESALDSPVYVRPVLRPDRRDWRPRRSEFMPDDVLPVDLIRRAVERIYDGEGEEEASAPSVRVINFSIGDPSQQFVRSPSALARMIDWLSWRYPALFIVSAGNHSEPIPVGAASAVLQTLTAQQAEGHTIRALVSETLRRRILAPAESINALTIGAAHTDASGPITTTAGLHDLIELTNLPAPYSAHGLGVRRGVKPDMLMPGGRALYQSVGDPGAGLYEVVTVGPPGQRVASPGATSGVTTATTHVVGTSNAAALATRAAASLYAGAVSEILGQVTEPHDPHHEIALLKGLLVHTAEWGPARQRIYDALAGNGNGTTLQNHATRLLGYGAVDGAALTCTEQRAVLVGIGALRNGEADEFVLPLPPSLSGRQDWRRLVITLAWLSPINVQHRFYRRAHLWVSPPREIIGVERQDANWQTVRRGTVQHECFEGDQVVSFVDGENLVLTVNCRADAGTFEERAPYAVVATLEVAPETGLPIYQEVAARIRSRCQSRREGDRALRTKVATIEAIASPVGVEVSTLQSSATSAQLCFCAVAIKRVKSSSERLARVVLARAA